MPLKTSAKRSLLQKNPAILVILRNNSLGPLDRVCIFGKYRKTTEIIKNRRQPVVYNGYILIYAFKLRTVSQLLRVAKKLFPYGFRLFAARRFRESFNFFRQSGSVRNSFDCRSYPEFAGAFRPSLCFRIKISYTVNVVPP